MRVKKRTVTETITHRVVTIRSRSCRRYHCPTCGHCADMLPVEEAAEALGISVASLHERSERGQVHFVEANGARWICRNWLSRST